MKDLLIGMPSYNRPYDIMKRAGKWIKDVMGVDWVICVEPDQYRYYRQNFDAKNLIENKIGGKLNGAISQIGTYAAVNGYSYVFKIDDDFFFKGLTGDGTRFSPTSESAKVLVQHGLRIVQFLKATPTVGAVGLYEWREADNAAKKAAKAGDFDFGHINRKLMGGYVTQPKFLIPCIEMGDILDDLVISVFIRQAGMDVLIYRRMYQDVLIGSNAGGLQSGGQQSRTDRELRTVNLLRDKLGINVTHTPKTTTEGRTFYVQHAPDLLPSSPIQPDHPYNVAAQRL